MKEHDIRPEHLLQRYLDLSARDAESCFGDSARAAISCVACGGEEAHNEFDKNGFYYVISALPGREPAEFAHLGNRQETCRGSRGAWLN